MRTMHTAVVLVAWFVTCPSLPAAAQSAQRSSIEGVVIDQQGGVVGGATVTLSGDRLLGGTRSATTDQAGRYRFGGLLPGDYDAVARATSLEDVRRAGIQLPVETTYTVNFTLPVAGVATRVEVPARGAPIDVRTAASPTVFSEPMLYDLPTERTLQSVLSLTPGVTTTTPLYGYVGEVAFGGTQGSNGFSVDGVNLTESSLGDQWSQVNYNWLEQVQVIGLGAPAEYGTFTGAIANGVLRSGSNRVHGMGDWLTIRPSWTATTSATIRMIWGSRGEDCPELVGPERAGRCAVGSRSVVAVRRCEPSTPRVSELRVRWPRQHRPACRAPDRQSGCGSHRATHAAGIHHT